VIPHQFPIQRKELNTGKPHTLAAARALGFRCTPWRAKILSCKLLDDGSLDPFEVDGSILELFLQPGQRDDKAIDTGLAILFRFTMHGFLHPISKQRKAPATL
jgi:hypothetical protein